MIANARIARTTDKPTSSLPHHFEKSAVFFERPATAGNAEEMTNSTAAVMARGRAQGRCGPVPWGASGGFAGGSMWSEGIGDYLDAIMRSGAKWKLGNGGGSLHTHRPACGKRQRRMGTQRAYGQG